MRRTIFVLVVVAILVSVLVVPASAGPKNDGCPASPSGWFLKAIDEITNPDNVADAVAADKNKDGLVCKKLWTKNGTKHILWKDNNNP